MIKRLRNRRGGRRIALAALLVLGLVIRNAPAAGALTDEYYPDWDPCRSIFCDLFRCCGGGGADFINCLDTCFLSSVNCHRFCDEGEPNPGCDEACTGRHSTCVGQC